MTVLAARRPATQLCYRNAVEAVIAHMRAHPGAPLNLAGMAELASVSRCHFDRLFRDVTGLSPRQFQTALRLNAASRLFLTTERSVTDVCFDVGYESLGTFVTKFTETFGLSPQRLRELAVSLHEPWSGWLEPKILAEFAGHLAPPYVTGEIAGCAPSVAAIIFVGVFPTPMPIRAPLACTILTAPGPFAFGPIPDGPGFLFAVAIALGDKPVDFLLQAPLRGGGMRVDPGAKVVVSLRPAITIDPPINIALPFLIAQKIVLS